MSDKVELKESKDSTGLPEANGHLMGLIIPFIPCLNFWYGGFIIERVSLLGTVKISALGSSCSRGVVDHYGEM